MLLYGDVAQQAEQFLHTEKVVGSDPTFTTKLWVLSKMNITFRYERKSGSLILSGPSIYPDSSMAEQTTDNR